MNSRAHDRRPSLRLISIAATATLVTAMVGVGASPVFATAPTCSGQPATIIGTPGNDTLSGTNGNDVIMGLGGDDVIRGRGGSDIICGGDGNDVVHGSRDGGDISGDAGNDTLYSRGGAGLTGGDGNDTLDATADGSGDLLPGPGDDLVIGSATQGDEVQYGFDATGPIYANLMTGIATGQGIDTLVDIDAVIGGAFNDTLIGNGGDNGLIGREGDDTLVGKGGDDGFAGQQGDDVYYGGPGSDTAAYYDQNFADGLMWGPMDINLRTGIATGDGTDTLSSIENATGSNGADMMIGNAKANYFHDLLAGDDTVRAGGGNDIVNPGAGANVIFGGPGEDTAGFYGGTDPDHLHGAVTVDLDAGTSSSGDSLNGFEDVSGSTHGDTLIGDDGPNTFHGDMGADILKGMAGDDFLVGNGGADEANGGYGTDRCRAETVKNCEG